MKIAIIVPMEIEAKYYRKYFHAGNKEMFGSSVFEHFCVKHNDIYIGLSGIGKVQAAMNLASLLTKVDIDLIFMTGTAGSLQSSIRKGDLLLADSFSYHDAHNTLAGNYVEGQIPGEPALFDLKSKEQTAFADFLQEQGIQYKKGLIVTGDSFIGSNEQKKKINQDFTSALGVEMEGAAFAQVAYHFQKKLIAIRAISDNGDDSANEDFDKFAQKVGAKAAKIICAYIEKMN
ncbi:MULTISPECIES: 5'-methylthioadenosine/adenosylhomocysteine nucleosidase [unclassified Lactobacillus]|uniref:5'-methylthioadenosine/adenosylhomocysteine nucleosidase n=1 Tax=unclassified Lactobacillus TaxID=2620435 RepID=UPI000EFA4EF4|nr:MULTISPECIES: 5'-methylthioadenosine/adenosylhomocysteine nucleosidase [unclassified Lactobacillus]RMC39864.1 5'-methylthioadenosine/adenosylhomocysteine nucleosidase [Lactobacillus sp. ESL0237]RMC44023.1 5'-methylthioadenosine/adenosylhomocysteine nucleosidase [Lactobacillus sp. ESL0234]RMC45353.1 5'-methylthioadenosine/adenosylhomocysteine nucleosidase [Lactobacillus sp. ESL0236]RMC50618.1 5'-methylthioadenosine/adenosylhomocysteine nucleosidase [Lactobacillus sp. ESL0225]